jgi:hypothetical protein
LITNCEEYDAPNSSRKKKKEDVQEIHSTSKETTLDSPSGGGDNEVEKEEKEGEEDKNKRGEITPHRNPLEEEETSNKRKVSPTKTTSRKKSRVSKPKLQIVLMVDDFDFIITSISDALEDILQRIKAKQETMYGSIEVEMRGVKQSLHSNRVVSVVTPPPEEPELGDEPTQLCRIVDVTEARLHCMKE